MTRKEKILARLEELGSRGPKRSLGQNFLISDRVVERILFAVQTLEFSELVEIGPGLGALTDDLLALERPMTLLELDRDFVVMWKTRISSAEPRVKVIECDALQVNWQELGLQPGALLVSNLPYQISSSVVIERCLVPAGINRMILMFQKEVAQRIAAKPETKEYGLLSVMAQVFWSTQTVCDASGADFYPPPKVSSRVLQFRLRPQNALMNGLGSPEDFLRFAKAAFQHRRKLLSRNLLGGFLHWSSESSSLTRLTDLFAKHGLKATVRAEELDAETFVRLYLALKGS